MKQKKSYTQPVLTLVPLMTETALLSNTGTAATGPSANFMENPSVSETNEE